MKQPLQLFFRPAALLLLLNALVKPVWILLIDRQVQLQTGTEAYGRYFALLNFSILFSIMADAGLSVYMNRQGAAAGLNTAMFRFFLRLKCILMLVYAAVVMLAALAWGLPLNGLLLLLIALQAGTSLLVFFRSAVTALQLYRADAWLSVLDKLLVIAVTGFILFALRPQWFSTGWFAAVQVCTVIIALFITWLLLQRHLPGAAAVQEPFSIRTQITRTLPYFAVVLFMTQVYRAGGVLVQRLHAQGNAEAGLYANGFRLLEALNMGGYLLASFLLPFISKHAANKPLVTNVVRQCFHFLWLLAAGAAGFCLFNHVWVHEWLYHSQLHRHALISAVTLAGIAGCSLVHIYSTVLTAAGYLVLLARISLGAALLMTAAGFIWIPAHGAMAAAIITCAGQLVYGAALLLACTAKRLLLADGRGWLRLLTATAITALFMLVIHGFHPFIQAMVLAVIVPVMTVGLKLVRINVFRSRNDRL